MKKIFVFFLICVACTKKPSDQISVEEIQTVSLGLVENGSFSEPITGSGVLSSKSELKLGFKTGGMIKRMYVSEGQSVSAGQLLAELDLSEIEAQVSQTELGLAKANRDAERVKKLYADSIATFTQLQDAQTGLEMARKTAEVASFNQKLSKIYAPVSGRVLRKISDQGELITPFAPALILATGSGAYIVNIGLSDKDIVKVKLGQRATISIDAYPNEKFNAIIKQIAQMVNPATGTFEVELEIENALNKKLISGFVAKAEIGQTNTETGRLAPIEGIIDGEGSFAYVYVYNKTTKKVNKKQIEIGKIYGTKVQVLSGLIEGERIVTAGANFLADNATVNIK